jgi:GntR family transcriptional regulator
VFFRVNPGSGIPLYLQIESQIKNAMASGALAEQALLPSVRKMASDLRVNPTTVTRAYSNLERDGHIRTVAGGGTYVLGKAGNGLLKSEKLRRVKPLAEQLVVEGKQLGLEPQDLSRLLDLACKELEAANG